MTNIQLKVGGELYTGWTSASVHLSLNQITGAFSLSATDPFPGKPEELKIKLGAPCEIVVEGYTVITGYIDDMDISYGKNSHTLQVLGRDVTGDLVDCTYAKTWKNVSAAHIVRDICDQFDIAVDIAVYATTQMNTKIGKLVAADGDTAFDTISKVCESVAVLPVSYGDGKLTITQAGTSYANDILETGVNILSGALSQSNRERFSEYTVKGVGAVGDNIIQLETALQPEGKATDDVIQRYRPFTILANGAVDTKRCQEMARWESRIRAGQSRTFTYEVQGWLQIHRSYSGIGDLSEQREIWPLNSLVHVKDHVFDMDSEGLISEVEFMCDDSTGTTTRLTVVHKDTYKLMTKPIKEMKTGFDIFAVKGT